VYFLLASSAAPKLLDSRLLRHAVPVGAVLTAGLTYLARLGLVSFPGILVLRTFQGGGTVVKSFNPGNSLIMFALLSSFFGWWHANWSVRRIALVCVFAVLFVSLIAFRAYWILGLGSILATLFLVRVEFNLSRSNIRFLLSGATALVALATIYYALYRLSLSSAAPWAATVRWIHSAFVAVVTRSDTFEYRYIVDISRLLRAWQTGDPLYRLFGIGFVATGSRGYALLGYSSESADSGWVEVALTGGLSSTIAITALWLVNLFRLRNLQRRTQAVAVTAMISIWLVQGLLMLSSNSLLWDVGFVPLAWAYLSALSQLDTTSAAAQASALDRTKPRVSGSAVTKLSLSTGPCLGPGCLNAGPDP
jgi:hypothetical protein